MKYLSKIVLLSLCLIIDLYAQDKYLFLSSEDLKHGFHHTKHSEIFSKYCDGYNLEILKAIDTVQKSAPDGGGYFIGIKANPPESPIGYDLKLLGSKLIDAPRKTSYCSGASYSVFIEALNLIFKDKYNSLPESLVEIMRMQEKDGSRREDDVKFWGIWNTNGFGSHFALAQYSGMGKQVFPAEARPGDFVNISWKNGNGHSTVFLGWYIDEDKDTNIVYFSSQKATNGLGDQIVDIKSIKDVMFVRLTNPERLFEGIFCEDIKRDIKGELLFSDK